MRTLQAGGKRIKVITYEEPLYSSPNIVKVIEPSEMKWAEHVAHMGGMSGFPVLTLVKEHGNQAKYKFVRLVQEILNTQHDT
jgi:hypothetical protein